MSQHFTHLHLHTDFSLLDGAITIDKLISYGKEHNFKSLAITDHGNMSSMHEAFKEYKKIRAEHPDFKFIPGNEIYFVEDLEEPKAKRRHLVLLAMNEVGYRNLLRITAAGFDNAVTVMNKQFPRVDADVLKKFFLQSRTQDSAKFLKMIHENSFTSKYMEKDM